MAWEQDEEAYRRSYSAWVMSGGRTCESYCCAVRKPSLRSASRKVVLSLYAASEIFAAFSYPMCGFRAVTSISELSRCSLIRFSFGSIPVAQRSEKERQASARRSVDGRTLWRMTGL